MMRWRVETRLRIEQTLAKSAMVISNKKYRKDEPRIVRGDNIHA